MTAAKSRKLGLDERLLKSASDSARYALRNYASADEENRSISALRTGMAVEHLQLAALFRKNPLLLATAERGDGQMQARARLLRDATGAPGSWTQLRTIGFQDASLLLGLIYDELKWPVLEHKLFANVRNAAAHLGAVDEQELASGVAVMVRRLDAILGVMKIDRGNFWSPELLTLVQTTLTTESDLFARRIGSLLADARQRYGVLISSMESDTRDTILRIMEAGPLIEAAHEDHVIEPCPACTRQGWVELEIHESEDPDDDFDDEGAHLRFDRVGLPVAFSCPVCQLSLSAREMRATGMDMDREHELFPRRVSYDSVYGDGEPDEDWLRGR